MEDIFLYCTAPYISNILIFLMLPYILYKNNAKGEVIMEKRKVHSLKGILILNAIVLIFALNASNIFADSYVIVGSRGVGKEIKSLPSIISSPGFYYITKDLSCAFGNHGITISTDNVTIDLLGFSLVGQLAPAALYDGIYMNDSANIEIRNGTVRNFRNGIYASGGKGHRIINIRASENANGGIILDSSSNIVEGCTVIDNNNTGIQAWDRSTVSGNVCSDNGNHGILTSSYSTVTGNTCNDNGLKQRNGHGITAGTGATVSGNNCCGNYNDGINASTGSTITGNTCDNNSEDGIDAGLGSTVVCNTCRSNTAFGINLGGNNLVDQNTATDNNPDYSRCTGCVYGVNSTVTP